MILFFCCTWTFLFVTENLFSPKHTRRIRDSSQPYLACVCHWALTSLDVHHLEPRAAGCTAGPQLHLPGEKDGTKGTSSNTNFNMNDDHLTVRKWVTDLQNIFLVRIQNKLEGLIPHRVYVIIEVSCSLPAVRGGGDEKFHVRVWSVNCRQETQARRMQKCDS